MYCLPAAFRLRNRGTTLHLQSRNPGHRLHKSRNPGHNKDPNRKRSSRQGLRHSPVLPVHFLPVPQAVPLSERHPSPFPDRETGRIRSSRTTRPIPFFRPLSGAERGFRIICRATLKGLREDGNLSRTAKTCTVPQRHASSTFSRLPRKSSSHSPRSSSPRIFAQHAGQR